MNHEAAIKTAANIYVAAVEFLANKHGVQMDEIINALIDGNEKICGQMRELMDIAVSRIKSA